MCTYAQHGGKHCCNLKLALLETEFPISFVVSARNVFHSVLLQFNNVSLRVLFTGSGKSKAPRKLTTTSTKFVNM